MILDTNVLIWLERETQRNRPGKATAFFTEHGDSPFYITLTIAGELAAGTSMANRDKWRRFLEPYLIAPIDEDAAWHYGTQRQRLASDGQLIGDNDLWIAATALAHDLPVVTGNVGEFQRVRGLKVIGI